MASWRHSPTPIVSENFFSSNHKFLCINRFEIIWRSIIKIEPWSDFQLPGRYRTSKWVTSRTYLVYLTSVYVTSVHHQTLSMADLGSTWEQIIIKMIWVPLEALGFVVCHTKNPHSEVSGDFFCGGLNTRWSVNQNQGFWRQIMPEMVALFAHPRKVSSLTDD